MGQDQSGEASPRTVARRRGDIRGEMESKEFDPIEGLTNGFGSLSIDSPSVVAMCVGASQADTDRFDNTEEIPLRHAPRGYRGPYRPLPYVMNDVKKVHEFLVSKKVESTSFCGLYRTSSMTKNRFLEMFNTMLEENKRLYIVFYAGHGCEEDGAFFMDDGRSVRLAELIKLWRERLAASHLDPPRLLIIADSCHSGHMVQELKRLPLNERRQLNIAVQAACLAKELSFDGLFTKAYIDNRQNGKNFKWAKHWKDTYPTCCRSCYGYYDPSCQNCEYMFEVLKVPRNESELQHPISYCTWADDTVREGEVEIKLYSRTTQNTNNKSHNTPPPSP